MTPILVGFLSWLGQFDPHAQPWIWVVIAIAIFYALSKAIRIFLDAGARLLIPGDEKHQ